MNKHADIEALIKLLEDPDENIYFQIRKELIDLGPSVIPELENRWEEESSLGLLFQSRVEDLIHDIQFNSVKKEIREWRDSDDHDLLRGMYLIAKYQYPDLTYEALDRAIESIKKEIWIELNSRLTAFENVRIINHVLFNVHNFQGNTSNYHAPQNSFLNNVLDTCKGNPISLSVIYTLIGQRLGLPIYGVNLPRHFVVAYVDPVFQSDHPTEENVLFYINPFSKGSVFGIDELKDFVQQINLPDQSQFFNPCDSISIVNRVLNNLINSYNKLGYPEKVEELKILQNTLIG
ncbi:MAG: transglutaminase-like domain-containing protein [Salibacter sp.]|uniref:transglutaminase-like domain-containing protein n=1 Tax=Salibacter sp. TaxID=2010995 RepID=UPI0028706976|nr:transglutaminase-like domain-containing protein [Salibacter sp.]MDR9398715.1 transglutaminase-like domain-containing protein [Salibacter sp.]